jgi:membrane-associated phospholipid phosphatase
MESTHDSRLSLLTSGVSRRTALRGLGGVGVATALGLAPRDLRASESSSGGTSETASAEMIEPEAGSWKTWVLTAGDQLRPDPPPDETATQKELVRLQEMAADRDAAVLDRISYWNAGSPGYRWNELAMQQTVRSGMALESYRLMPLLNAAIYDATIAAWDAKYAYTRLRPAVTDITLSTVMPTPNSPSYPDAHAVTAGAAATVLAYVFPDEAERFQVLATEAADSRAMAGVAYPSDTAAGLELGQQVGKLVVAYAKRDGSDAVFDPSTMPTGPGLFTADPATIVGPTVAAWKPWVLASADQFRPGPPPAPDSPERAAEIAELKDYPRDAHPFTELWFWPQDPAGRPAPDTAPFSSNQVVFYYAPLVHYLWGPELAQKLFEYRWDTNAPRAARAYALVSVAGYDSTVACWDGKFFYWTARPDQFDPEISTILPTYPNPDYPSGHSTGLAATAEVLSYLFPRDEQFFQSRAEEDAASRIWAGIHFRSATEAGLQLGRDVGDAVIAWAEGDGSV